MKGFAVNFCLFVSLTLGGTWGLEVTINTMRNASITLVCSIREDIRMCPCHSYPLNCNTKCPVETKLNNYVKIYQNSREKHFKFSGLQSSDSGLYTCYEQMNDVTPGNKYWVNVFEDRDPTVVIGTVGKSIVMTCGNGLNISAASNRHWCRLVNGRVCDTDTIMAPEDGSKENVWMVANKSSFSLEKHQLSPSDAGFYKCSITIHNETKALVVELQVENSSSLFQVNPRQVSPNPGEQFEIACRYSLELQEYQKYWLCNNDECPDTVKTVDDSFQSALVLTMKNVQCSRVTAFQCVAKMSTQIVKSKVYHRPVDPIPIKEVTSYLDLSVFSQHDMVEVTVYTNLKLTCVNYDREWNSDWRWQWDTRLRPRWDSRYDSYYDRVQWCKVDGFKCVSVRENTRDWSHRVTIDLCVTPEDDGTTYRCMYGRRSVDIHIVVKAAPPPRPVTPAWNVVTEWKEPPSSGLGLGATAMIVITSVILLIFILFIIFTKFKGQRLSLRYHVAFSRRTKLSAVDVHANEYANSLAQYYNYQRQQLPTDHKQAEGDNEETSSSSTDEFEDLSVEPNMPSCTTAAGKDYVTVKSGGSLVPQSDYINACLRDSKQLHQPRLPLPNYENVSVLTEKEVEEGKLESAAISLREQGGSESNSEDSNDKSDDDGITYTRIIIKPRNRAQ